MTDDKTERVAEQLGIVGEAALALYNKFMEEGKGILPENATGLVQTLSKALIEANYPRYSNRSTGGSRGSGANYDNPTPIKKEYVGFLKGMEVDLLEKFGKRESVDEYKRAVWLEFHHDLPYEEDMSKWTTGQGNRYRDVTKERHPDLSYWKKEGK